MKSKLLLTLIMFAPAIHADDSGFTATLQGCTELIGLGPVPLSVVRPLVPSTFVIPEFGPGTAGLVVRVGQCQALSTSGTAARPVNVGQIGVAIVSPDGSGDINNYTLFYTTSDDRLARALQDAGLPAALDPVLAYEFTPNLSGELYAAVAPFGAPAWFVSGSAADTPLGGPAPVTANWWFQTKRGTLKMATVIPSIQYVIAGFTLHTSKVSPLGQIIGGNTDSSFPFFNARGLFSTGVMSVSSR